MKVVFWLLHPDPQSRATLKDLKKDKWTNQTVDISHYSFETVLGEFNWFNLLDISSDNVVESLSICAMWCVRVYMCTPVSHIGLGLGLGDTTPVCGQKIVFEV